MRFSALISLALTLATAVVAAPSGNSPALAGRDASLTSPDNGANAYRLEASEEVITRDVAKFNPSKIDLDFPKKLQKGSIPQKQREDAVDLAKRAMYQASVTAGEIIYGWHDENTEDPVEHFTVNPTKGDGAGKGKIHVHRDGSWTQGTGGKAAHGDGHV